MNDQNSTYLKALALALLSLIFIIDLMAVHQLFENQIQVALFGAVLAIQTLMIVAYHNRCIECEGCMKKAGGGIYLFYKVFAAIGFFSMLIILLDSVFSAKDDNLKIIVALTYAALLITGASTAFNAIIGVRNVSGHEKATKSNDDTATTQQAEAKMQELKTLAAWQAEEEARQQKSLETQKKQIIAREQARKRMEKRNSKRHSSSGVKV